MYEKFNAIKILEEEFDENGIRAFLEKDEVCFLSKDKKPKEKVANKIYNILMKMFKEDLEEETKKVLTKLKV